MSTRRKRSRKEAAAAAVETEEETFAPVSTIQHHTYIPRPAMQNALWESTHNNQSISTGNSATTTNSSSSIHEDSSVTLQNNLLDVIGTVSCLWMEQRILLPLIQHKKKTAAVAATATTTASASSKQKAVNPNIVSLQDVMDTVQNIEEDSKQGDAIVTSLRHPQHGALSRYVQDPSSFSKPKKSRGPFVKKKTTSKSIQSKEGVDPQALLAEDPGVPREPQTVVHDEEDYD